MANSFTFKEQSFQIGDTITIDYRIKDGEKERIQEFQGILIAIKGGAPESRMFTVRKMSKSGVGVERIIPVNSPFVANITLDKKSTYQKAKLYFLKDLSSQETRQKLYKQKKTGKSAAKKEVK
jgi:large subunit ribosomal protein L19